MSAKYPEIKQYIINQIEKKEYKPGSKLPAEKHFVSMFNVSRMTVRRAFDELIQDGILIRKADSGVFIPVAKIERSKSQISTSNDVLLHQLYKNMTVKIIDFNIIHNDVISKKYLGIEDEDIIQLKRIQFGDGHPIVYENIFLPVKYFTKFSKDECLHSFHDIVQKHLICPTDEILENEILIESKLATKTLSSLLQIPINSPILQLKITAVGKDGTKYFCGINSYSGDEFTYRA